VYLILFLSATYFLNRPCVYCSLLLFILVVALFDFHTPWFEPPLSSESAAELNNATTAPFRDGLIETAAVFAQAANQTAQALIKTAVDAVRERASGSTVDALYGNGTAGYEWVKGLMGKKEWRIQCLDVLVRV
jgi:hypothetical protein